MDHLTIALEKVKMNEIALMNLLALCAKGHAFDQLQVAQIVAAKDQEIANLKKRVSELEEMKNAR